MKLKVFGANFGFYVIQLNSVLYLFVLKKPVIPSGCSCELMKSERVIIICQFSHDCLFDDIAKGLLSVRGVRKETGNLKNHHHHSQYCKCHLALSTITVLRVGRFVLFEQQLLRTNGYTLMSMIDAHLCGYLKKKTLNPFQAELSDTLQAPTQQCMLCLLKTEHALLFANKVPK